MADHRLAWVPRRYTCTALPRRTHTERPLSALVRVITLGRGAGPPWQAPGREVPGCGSGDGELAGGADDVPASGGAPGGSSRLVAPPGDHPPPPRGPRGPPRPAPHVPPRPGPLRPPRVRAP